MDDEPSGGQGPAGEERENHLLIVGLRIALVALVILVGILAVGKYVVAKADLKEAPGTSTGSGPVPVNPITMPPTPSATPTDSSAASSPLPTLSEAPAPTDTPPSDPLPPGLVLTISPDSVASGQTFTVSGTYSGRDGVSLQLQRLEDGIWADYPNDVEVAMGQYSTTASSTMTGTNSFRVFDQSTNRASNVVSVLVR